MKNLLITFFVLVSAMSFAQTKGKIYGKVKDRANALEPLSSVRVYVNRSKATYTATDESGYYELEVLPGKQLIVFKKSGYELLKLEVVVEPGQRVELSANMQTLAYALKKLEEKNKRKKRKNKENLRLMEGRVAVEDTISITYMAQQQMKDVARSTSEISAFDQGKLSQHLNIGGFADSYHRSTVNGLLFTGVNPSNNSVTANIYPDNFVEKITVQQMPDASESADVLGALVQTTIKEYKGSFYVKPIVGVSYNPNMHLNANYLKYEGSDTDVFAYDNGFRDLPIASNRNIPSNGSELSELTSAFNNELQAKQATSTINYNLGVSVGGSSQKNGNHLGFQTHIAYENQTRFFENAQDNIFYKEAFFLINPTNLASDRTSTGSYGENQTSIKTLGDFYYHTDQSKFSLHFAQVFKGVSQAGRYNQLDQNLSSELFKDALTYTQSSLTHVVLEGVHLNSKGNWKFNWILSPNFNQIQDKDHRVTPLVFDGANYSLYDDEEMIRIWRNTEEAYFQSRVDVEYSHRLFNSEKDSQLKMGVASDFKDRAYGIDDFTFDTTLTSISNGNSDILLSSQNIWNDQTQEGTFLRADNSFESFNQFDANQMTIAAYLMEHLQIDNFELSLGARIEQFYTRYTGEDQQSNVFDNQEILQNTDVFPTAHIGYKKRLSSMYLSYRRSVQRPEIQDLSTVKILDPITTRYYAGNLLLESSYAHNARLDFSWYGTHSSFIKVAAFYKEILNPLELVFADNQTIQVQNTEADQSNVYGFELNIRKNFRGFLEGFGMQAQGVLNVSTLNLSELEFSQRELSNLNGETTPDTRDIQGQAPFEARGSVDYQKNDFDVSVSYQVQGKTLQIAGVLGAQPDVYTQPFHSLNVRLSKSFGAQKNNKISLQAFNLLDDVQESHYEALGLPTEIFSLRAPGRQFSMNYSYLF